MPPHLSKTCPQDNNCLIILRGIQINLVGKIYCFAACTKWHLKWWPRVKADRQWPQTAVAFIHLLAALSASCYALGHRGQVHTPTGSVADGPHCVPAREQHWPRPPRTLWVLPSTAQVSARTWEPTGSQDVPSLVWKVRGFHSVPAGYRARIKSTAGF